MNSPKPSPENKAQAEQLVDFMMKVGPQVELAISTELNKGSISHPQFFLLTYLVSTEFLIMSDIAKKMGHCTAAATGMVDKLEKMHLVERFHSAEDRRKIMVQITNKGVEFVTKMRQEIHTVLSEMLMKKGVDTTVFEETVRVLQQGPLASL